jgi:hypothetical protein
VRVVAPALSVGIRGNSIWDNAGPGIDLGPDGVTSNDSGDGDSGPNDLQNFPVLTLATPSRIAGHLDTVPGFRYIVEFFVAAPDSSGHGEGKTYLGGVLVPVEQAGAVSFVLDGLSLAPGSRVTATATPVTNLGLSYINERTSEFSPNVTVLSQDTGDFAMAAATASVVEGAGSVVLTVTRSGGSFGAATVNYATTAGTAAAGSDFISQSGTLSFANGQTSRTLTVPNVGDSLDEPNETFTVALSNPAGGPLILTPASTVVTLLDDDNPPAISINNIGIKEGNAGTTPITFTVSLAAPSSLPVSVNWTSVDVTATHTIDYTGGGSGTLVFAPGEAAKTLTFQAVGDLSQETNETFHVVLSSPVNATLGTDTGTGSILDDDSPGAIQIAATSYAISESSETGINIFIFRNGGGGPVTVDYAFGGGTATADADYYAFPASGTLSFGSGETVKMISVSPVDDDSVEGDETFLLTLSTPTGGATLGSVSAATMTLVDDDFSAILFGRIGLEDGAALPGVTVALGGDGNQTTTTDANGFYYFHDLPLGADYTVTPSLEGHNFDPESLSFTDLADSTFAANITAFPIPEPVLYLVNNGDGTITLSWPAAIEGWLLERSTTLMPKSWQVVLTPPTVVGQWKELTLPITGDRGFFRLREL